MDPTVARAVVRVVPLIWAVAIPTRRSADFDRMSPKRSQNEVLGQWSPQWSGCASGFEAATDRERVRVVGQPIYLTEYAPRGPNWFGYGQRL